MDKERVSVILVPQGAEYQAVCRGLSRAVPRPIVQAIPAGVQPVRDFLSLPPLECFSSPGSVLVLGLCGSLTPTLAVGDLVLYRQCISLADPARVLPTQLGPGNLSPQLPPLQEVVGLTSDRVIWAAAEKIQLGQTHAAEVVDMEGTAILEALSQHQIPVTMLRVVSDDCQHDLPDLTQSISPSGALLPSQLAIALLKNPIAAARLIRGSLQGLKVLQKVVSKIFHTE